MSRVFRAAARHPDGSTNLYDVADVADVEDHTRAIEEVRRFAPGARVIVAQVQPRSSDNEVLASSD